MQVPRVRGLRPTGDRQRETLFNVIGAKLPGARVLDLFAGSGALGIEALSRGADSAVFVERNAAAARVLVGNLERCWFGERGRVLRCNWRQGLARLGRQGARFDWVLLDPPYESGLAEACLRLLPESDLLAADARVVVEIRRGKQLYWPASLACEREVRVGDTAFLLARCVAEVTAC